MTPPKVPGDVLDHLDEIRAAADGGYTLTDDAKAFFAPYLRRYGFDLAKLSSRSQLVDAVRYCNALDFEKLVRKPAPEPGLRFVWNRLRKIART